MHQARVSRLSLDLTFLSFVFRACRGSQLHHRPGPGTDPFPSLSASQHNVPAVSH
jgi:hypothetical protein